MPRVNEEWTVSEAFVDQACDPTRIVVFLIATLVLFALFAVHQLVIWLSSDPVRAFHLAKVLASGVSSVWNTLQVLYNAANDVVTALLPSWNLLAIHIVEPTVFTALDVVSLVFTGNAYGGIITDTSTFDGHVCDGTEASAKWCTVQAKYAEELGITEAESSNVIQNNSKLLLSTAHVRRLQALSGQSLIGALPIEPLVQVVEDITGVIIMVLGQLADVGFHVVWTILHEVAVIIYNLIMVLIQAISAAILQIMSTGIVQNLLKIGLDIFLTLIIHIALPLLLAQIDAVMCLINLIMPNTWPDQLRCVEQTCFQEDGDIGAEIFTTFSSIPIVVKQIQIVLRELLNPTTGRRFGQAAHSGTDKTVMGDDIDPGRVGSPAATTCAECFTCRVPELRALWLLIAMTWGCAMDESHFAGRLENTCLDDGSWYLEACGPRTSFLTDSQWGATYLKHRDFSTERAQDFAGQLEQLAEDLGGGANGFAAKRIADAWFKRNLAAGGVGGPDQAAPFFRRMCEQMRIEYPDKDVGPGSTSAAAGTMKYIVGGFLYKECKYQNGFDLCSNPFAMNAVDGWNEIKVIRTPAKLRSHSVQPTNHALTRAPVCSVQNCMFNGPACRREREVCLGRCGGNVSELRQDFHTFASKVELSQRVLGTQRLTSGRANCTVRSHNFEVPLFEGLGEQFIRYASRLRVRGGFTGATLGFEPSPAHTHPMAWLQTLQCGKFFQRGADGSFHV